MELVQPGLQVSVSAGRKLLDTPDGMVLSMLLDLENWLYFVLIVSRAES